MKKVMDKITPPQYHRLTDTESRLVFHLIKEIQNADSEIIKYRCNVAQLLTVARLTEEDTQYLLRVMINLFRKIVHVDAPSGWTKYHWFDVLDWNAEDEFLTFYFNGEFQRRLSRLRKELTVQNFKKMAARGIFSPDGLRRQRIVAGG